MKRYLTDEMKTKLALLAVSKCDDTSEIDTITNQVLAAYMQSLKCIDEIVSKDEDTAKVTWEAWTDDFIKSM